MLRHIRSVGLVLLGLLALTAPAMSQSADFDVTQVANGVYAVIAKPGIASNGAFIVGQDDVVVVDTHLRPSWARETIAEIKKVTDKPVRYVINTHWHRDHVQGNQAYIAAFGPGVTIIQQDFEHHELTHMGGPTSPQNLQAAQINKYIMSQYADLARTLKGTQIGASTLLDQTIIYGVTEVGEPSGRELARAEAIARRIRDHNAERAS